MPNDLKTPFDRFLARPASLLLATLAIIAVTAATVLLGALFLYAFDDAEFDSYGHALWFTLQTATTVGYGDVTPERTIGRIAAAGVMLVSLGLLTVMTATITSYLIRYATRSANQANHDEITAALAQLEAAVLALSEQLDDARNEIARTDGEDASPSSGDSG